MDSVKYVGGEIEAGADVEMKNGYIFEKKIGDKCVKFVLDDVEIE